MSECAMCGGPGDSFQGLCSGCAFPPDMPEESRDRARRLQQELLAARALLRECRGEMVRLALMLGKPARHMVETLIQRIDAALGEER